MTKKYEARLDEAADKCGWAWTGHEALVAEESFKKGSDFGRADLLKEVCEFLRTREALVIHAKIGVANGGLGSRPYHWADEIEEKFGRGE